MSEHTLVVIDQAQPLADSREIARHLGIEHRSFFRMITEYREEIESDFGKVRFEIAKTTEDQRGRGRPSSYAWLTEDQTYAYMSYSQNTPQARACKRLLVKAFREAREQLAAASASQPAINSLWEERLLLFRRETKIPEGYWCIFEMIAAYCWTDEYRGMHLSPEALPDVSIGLLWCQYLREHGYNLRRVRKYPHTYPDRRGTQLANIYPSDWLGAFWTWFHSCYLKEHYPTYLQGRTISTTTTPVASLPQAASTKTRKERL
jgi:phage regulator Rha-like protein